MPKVHYVKAARQDNPAAKKGEPYYWWKFRYGGKRFSKTPPKPSQLTNSPFRSRALALGEFNLSDLELSDLEAHRDEALSEVQDLQSEAESSLEAMPEGLQQGDTGQMLQGRIDAMSEMESALDDIDFEFDPDQAREEAIEELADETDPEDEGRITDLVQEKLGEFTEQVRDELQHALEYSGD